jgi:hypothetical protein
VQSVLDYVQRAFGSAKRPKAFLEIIDETGRDDLFWPCVAALWSGFDAIDQDAYSKKFRALRARVCSFLGKGALAASDPN